MYVLGGYKIIIYFWNYPYLERIIRRKPKLVLLQIEKGGEKCKNKKLICTVVDKWRFLFHIVHYKKKDLKNRTEKFI